MRVIDLASTARFLLDPDERQVLKPFFGEGSSVGQAAAVLGVKPNTLLKRVTWLRERGLLRVAGEQPRGGRPIKTYRVTSEAFFVPFHVTDALSLEDLLHRAVEEPNRLIARSIARMYLAQSRDLGYLVHRLPGGRLAHDLSLGGTCLLPDASWDRPWFRDGVTLRLTRERAGDFVRALQRLIEEYGDERGDPYLAFFAVAPHRPGG